MGETLSIRLDEELADALERESRETGLPKGEIVRRALAAQFDRPPAASTIVRHFATVRGPVAPSWPTPLPPMTMGAGVASTVRDMAADGERAAICPRAYPPPSSWGTIVPAMRRPHREQYGRWSAFSCAQCRQGRIAVVSLLQSW